MKKELNTKYNHLEVEEGAYASWIKEGYFRAGDKHKIPYTIVIPPPNVTGKLHLGHAWDNALQDIIARFKRMQGYDMLYLPGMDHAGIATQAKVDQRLKEQGVSRYDLGRDKFLEKAWQWKEEYARHIREQWAKLGISVDYSRERFTLDEGLNKAVNRVFIDLYNAGLIYRGHRIINWDPAAQTALSNIEVIHKEIEGAFYTFRYPIVGTDQFLEVSTTRPETMFGDVCVFVHPDDERYFAYHGMKVINPANGQEMPIMTDDYIDIEFGTGAMKCTPAHDPNDFALAEKYGLKRPICMNLDATMNELAGEFNGMDRFECRKALVKRIEAEGNLVKIEKHIHQVGHSERTDVIVEPTLSWQWFVKMKPLADDVLKYQGTDDGIQFYPERFNHTFSQWLENIDDWCISRQLWWGHRIPAWFHNETGEIYVGEVAPSDSENWTQDEDVLDTWFSSALWPFSTLGWPEETEDFKRYYPTSTMVTGYDIIFFWVARMAFQGRYFTGQSPFKQCLIHGLIRDSEGRKMSKSLGNGVDPMEVIERYGSDALRFFLTTNSAPGLDLRYSQEKIESAWNFINKMWNASRFVLMNLGDDFKQEDLTSLQLSDIDRWICTRFDVSVEKITQAMENFDFALAGAYLYEFVWDDYCSWYIELSKSNLMSHDETLKKGTQQTLAYVLKGILKLCHPSMPFVTEKIYAALEESPLCLAEWPNALSIKDQGSYQAVAQLISIVSEVRSIKTEYQLKPSSPLDIKVSYQLSEAMLGMLRKLVKTEVRDNLGNDLITRPVMGGSISLAKGDLVNIEEEKARLLKEKERLEAEIRRSEGMLANERFMASAPEKKIQEEKMKHEDYQRQYQLIVTELEKISSL